MSLKKQLSVMDLFCLSFGAMISSGIFILPGIAFAHAGPAVVLSYFLAGVLAVLGILSVIELTTALPKSGGDYFFINTTFGPLIGTVSGMLSWLAISLKTAFAIFGIAEVIFLFFGINIFVSSLLLCLFFTCLNILGTKGATRIEVTLVVFLFSLLLFFIFQGSRYVQVNNFSPFFTQGKGAVFSTMGLIFVSFGGLLKIASISEEVKNPKYTIPMGMLSAVVLVTVFYAAILVVVVGVLPANELAASLTPVADCAKITMGQSGLLLITLASLLAFVTTAIAGMMSASRYPVGLSNDELLPAFFGRISKKYHTPVASIVLTGMLIALSLLMDLENLVKIASTVVICSYIFTNFSLIVLRESKIHNYRPSFKVPFYPFLPAANIMIFTYLITDMGATAAEVGVSFIFLGVLVYGFYGRKNTKKEYALIHLLERIVNKKLTTHSLEDEFLEIIHQRDDVVKDRFDNILDEAKFIDIKGAETKDSVFSIMAKEAAEITGQDAALIEKLIRERDDESTTALSPFVAIPHLIIEGEKMFKLVVARSSEGIKFNDDYSSVKAIFLLVGTKDERHFHLQALAAIAQISYNKNFEKFWLGADSEKDLRDVLLLSKRKRQ